MRSLFASFLLISLPIVVANAEESSPTEAIGTELPAQLPANITPETLEMIALQLEELSRDYLVRIPGGRKTADQRRRLSFETDALAKDLSAAAAALSLAQTGSTEISAQLADAEANAIETTYRVASEVSDLGLKQELFELLDDPSANAPQPVTHVFCMEASGAGPRTFARYAPEALTEALPYVQGYISHEIEQPAPLKLRLVLTVEHDADSAPFAAVDALQQSNRAAVAEMNDPNRQAAETILMDEYAERLCLAAQ